MYYAALVRPDLAATSAIAEMARLLVIIVLYGCFGYIVNSHSDRRVDELARKPNALSGVSDRKSGLIVGALACAGLGTTFWFYFDRPTVVAAVLVSYAVATAYSIAPIRLKERGGWGLLAGSLPQRALPAGFVFEAMGVWDWTSVVICFLFTMIGLRSMAVHQARDYKADKAAGVKTVATTRGAPFVKDLVRLFFFPLELAATFVVLCLMAMKFPIIMAFAALYIWYFFIKYHATLRSGHEVSMVSYDIFADFYYLYWPLVLSIILASHNVAFLALTALHLLLCFGMIRIAARKVRVISIWLYRFARNGGNRRARA
jgi:4-hydroxybenzoate polyprenyltransferase